MKPLTIALAASLALAALASPASAQKNAYDTYRVRANDTLALIAAEYYGDRNHRIFIQAANGMDHTPTLKKGQKLKIPITQTVYASAGDTWEGLAERYLGDKARAPFLASFNSESADDTLAAGQAISIPFHVTHTAADKETLRQIAAGYFKDANKADMLEAYNGLDKSELAAGETIVVPIFHVSVRQSKLPEADEESKARLAKRNEMMSKAAEVLPEAREAWRQGNYSVIKRELTQIKTEYLDTELAVEIGVLLGATYVAFDDIETALSTFDVVLERKPKHELEAYDYSPKVRSVWQQATER